MQGFGWRGVPEAEDRPAGFLKLLRTIAEHPSRPAVILATMRCDFLDNFQKHPPLAGIRWEPLSLGPMSAMDSCR